MLALETKSMRHPARRLGSTRQETSHGACRRFSGQQTGKWLNTHPKLADEQLSRPAVRECTV